MTVILQALPYRGQGQAAVGAGSFPPRLWQADRNGYGRQAAGTVVE
ncbi:MAG: hypothetical protein LBS42_09955 [Tannerella sp.]|nr:hypothetical protein [Tannerella sp.]